MPGFMHIFVSNSPTQQSTKQKLISLFNKMKDAASNRYIQTLALASEFLALNLSTNPRKADIIVAGLPLYSVQKEGHAASDEILKYRSIGGIFLAHQKGGKKTFQFTIKVFGEERLMVLAILKKLQRIGIENRIEIGDTNLFNLSNYQVHPEDAAIPVTQDTYIEKYINDYTKIGKEDIAYHKTFPIITNTRIYTNMYMETLRYREDIELGLNCMEITCAFRQYIAPDELWIKKVKSRSNEDENTKGYYKVYLSEDTRLALKRTFLGIDISWFSLLQVKSFFEKQRTEEQWDTYAVDTASLALSLTTMAAGYMKR